jgi:3'-phosphoadenosine 5'-phosphosulfate sulfotransferase (PAPS reductase)/FAD synthetase
MNIKAQLARLWSNEFGPEALPELEELNRAIEPLSATQRVERTLELLPGEHVLTSSFGAQSAVMLHLVNTVMPGVPVVLLDTGYLFPETYDFIDELTRARLVPIEFKRGRYKVQPLYDWGDRDIGGYLESIIPCGNRAMCPSVIGTRPVRLTKCKARTNFVSSA